MNRPAPQQPSRKKAALSITILVVLTGVVFWIFKSHWAEISSALAQLKFWQVAVVLAVGLTYPVLEGLVSYVISGADCPGSPCVRRWNRPSWAASATSSALGPGPCRCSPTTSTAAGCRWAPAWA